MSRPDPNDQMMQCSRYYSCPSTRNMLDCLPHRRNATCDREHVCVQANIECYCVPCDKTEEEIFNGDREEESDGVDIVKKDEE